MPPNGLVPTVNITATTNQYLAPRWVDQVLRDNLFYSKMLKNPEKWRGSQMLHPMKYQKGIASVAFNGFDVLPITQQPVTVNMTFYPSFVATNVALSGTDLSVNQAEGNAALETLKLMDVMMKSRAQDASDDIGNFFQGDGTGSGGKAPMGLLGIVDNGTDLATYGGLSRATYSGLNATVTASGGTISLLKIRQLNNAIADGPIKPDMIITDYNTWAYVEQLMTPYQRNNYTSFKKMDAGASGYEAMYWGGMEIFRDKKITSGYFYELNTEFLKFYALKWWEGQAIAAKTKDIVGNVYEESAYDPASAFTWTGWIKAYNMGAINGFVILGGQLVCVDPFRNGVLTGITGV
jgi:hypothetical protein